MENDAIKLVFDDGFEGVFQIIDSVIHSDKEYVLLQEQENPAICLIFAREESDLVPIEDEETYKELDLVFASRTVGQNSSQKKTEYQVRKNPIIVIFFESEEKSAQLQRILSFSGLSLITVAKSVSEFRELVFSLKPDLVITESTVGSSSDIPETVFSRLCICYYCQKEKAGLFGAKKAEKAFAAKKLEFAEEGRQNGASGVIFYPFDSEDIIKRINRILGR